MKNLILIFFLAFIFQGCNKPKTVMICGDHICVNKEEARQYFKENLTIEVKIVDKKKTKEIDLVQLNLNDKNIDRKSIYLKKKNQTKKKLRKLSDKEIKKIKIDTKKNLKKDKKEKKINKENVKLSKRDNNIKKTTTLKVDKKIDNKNLNNKKKEIDICEILDDCNIEEISKYLIKQGKNKRFPDISKRE